MGGRGASGAGSGAKMTEAAKNYRPYKYGMVTKMEAGTIYRAVKTGSIKAKPETTKELYNTAESYQYIPTARQSYSQNRIYYDRIYDATKAVLNNDFKTAQREITLWEDDNIRRATKKSKWYKYKNGK